MIFVLTEWDSREPGATRPTVLEIWRYPVKSLGGERLTRAPVLAEGIPGDRAWCVRDAVTGEIVSAKRDARLLYAWAGTGPDGSVHVGVPGLAAPVPVATAGATLSAWLGRRVEMQAWRDAEPSLPFDFGFAVEEDAHCFGDCGDVLHLIATGTLDRFAELAREPMTRREAVRRTRPNFVVDLGPEPFREDAWIGRSIEVGGVRLAVAEPTGRCVVVERGQPGYGPRPELLDALTDLRNGQLGVYATVERPGSLAELDDLRERPAI